ncbi:hypothetical protein AVEN_80620-1 [Araneus ventricosus]|uniref:Uncharacterized protein n=1 Tax=Araneus ventricosus TaxID=182803 RepID=A0A4Y2V2P2_ARAVE|nr:hypothetical protein AVEN_80620-1 [Araneus ventricosus]
MVLHNARSTTCQLLHVEQNAGIKDAGTASDWWARRVSKIEIRAPQAVEMMLWVSDIRDTLCVLEFEDSLIEAMMTESDDGSASLLRDVLPKIYGLLFIQGFCTGLSRCVDPGSSPVRQRKYFVGYEIISCGMPGHLRDMPQC